MDLSVSNGDRVQGLIQLIVETSKNRPSNSEHVTYVKQEIRDLAASIYPKTEMEESSLEDLTLAFAMHELLRILENFTNPEIQLLLALAILLKRKKTENGTEAAETVDHATEN